MMTEAEFIDKLDTALAAKHIWNVDFTDMKFFFGKFLDKACEQAHGVYLANNPIRDGEFSRRSWGREFDELYYFHPQVNSFGKFRKLLGKANGVVQDRTLGDVQAKTLAVVAAFEYVYATFEPLARKMTDLKQYIVKGRKPSEQVSDADRRTIENTGTCPICSKNVKLEGGKLVDHGFRVEGRGRGYAHKHGRCFGVGHKPIEVSPEGAQAYLVALRNQLLNIEAEIKNLSKLDIISVADYHGKAKVGKAKVYRRGESGFDRAISNESSDLEGIARRQRCSIQGFEEMVSNWAPRALPDGKVDHLK